MNERIIIIEAESLDKAREKLWRDELVVIRETVLCGGQAGTAAGIAETIEDALAEAESKIPPESKTEKPEIKTASRRFKVKLKGDSEEIIKKEIRPDNAKIIESIVLRKKGRKGFWGFFKRPNIYKVTIFQRAQVEIKFRKNARIEAKVRDYSAEGLLETIQELRAGKSQWSEIPGFLNPKNDSKIRQCLQELQTSYASDLNSALYFIEIECRKNGKTDWRTTIKDAHWRALLARSKRKTALRQLDVDIAGDFMFYTSIDWYAKHYETKLVEPKGLPRDGYGGHQAPSPTLRRTIPHYSTNEKDFSELERRIEAFGLLELYSKILAEAGHEKDVATLEQKCSAALKALKMQGQSNK